MIVAKLLLLGVLESPMTWLKRLSDVRGGALLLVMAFLAGVGLTVAYGEYTGLPDRMLRVENQQEQIMRAVLELQCRARVADEVYATYTECWESTNLRELVEEARVRTRARESR